MDIKKQLEGKQKLVRDFLEKRICSPRLQRKIYIIDNKSSMSIVIRRKNSKQ